ncbi:nucleotidyltransferase family protein [Prevotella sp.]|nr:nucleotidyltransferase family protein [Prevotella sp.]
MKKQHQIFFDFLRFSIGSESEIPSSLKEADWKELYRIAQKQCLVGILFDGIQKLPPAEVGMSKDLLLQWMMQCQMLERANVRLNDAAIQVSEWFRKKGFRTCILKGQGNALMYPNPYSRTPGDIDIWVEGVDKRVISFVRSISPHEKACYHHIEFPSYKGVEVEVHYRPSFLLCFWHNRKLQKYYERVKEEQFSHRVMLGEQGEIAIPTVEFNLIFQLTHIYAHLMNEGIGLRQLVDYYYVLCDFYKVYQKSSNPSVSLSKGSSTFSPSPSSSGSGDVTALLGARNRYALRLADHQRSTPDCAGWDRLGVLQKELKEVGLWKFAGGIMYIMKEVFGMPASRLIVPPNEKYGRFVLNEVLEAGNFGRHDARNRFGRSKFGHNLQRVYRDIRLVRYFPAEALCEPLFRTWHFFWRLKYKK